MLSPPIQVISSFEQLGFDVRVRASEPGISEPAHANREAAAVERHGGDNARAFDAAGSISRRFGGGHGQA
jgi:hypothetical protein